MPFSVPSQDGLLPRAGDVVAGKYRVGRTLAEGGMGIIVEAVHVHLDEIVAIKLLREEFFQGSDETVVPRFMREARASIRIRSEHVVRVIDVGCLESGLPFIVMERLVGRDLDHIVEESGPLPVEDAVDYVLQALEAIAEAHTLGVVHRDLKPANLFLAERADGSPCIKVLDFGISKIKLGAHDMGVTQTQSVMGSPRYMSPEQVRAARDVDGRADIWAVGIVLTELLTGRPPFDGDTVPQVAAAIVENAAPPPSVSRPEVPSGLDAVIACCLSKRPADRYDDVAQLAAALGPFGSERAAASVARIQGVLRVAATNPPPPRDPVLRTDHDQRALELTTGAWGVPKDQPSSYRWLFAGACAVVLIAIGVLFTVLRTSSPAPVAFGSAPSSPEPAGAVTPPSSATPPPLVAASTRDNDGTEGAVSVDALPAATPDAGTPLAKGAGASRPFGAAPQGKPSWRAPAPRGRTAPASAPTSSLWDERK